MLKMNATKARNNISALWRAATNEPVTVEGAGKPIAVVISPQEYARLSSQRKPREGGFAKDLFVGVDMDDLLATPIDDIFAEAPIQYSMRMV